MKALLALLDASAVAERTSVAQHVQSTISARKSDLAKLKRRLAAALDGKRPFDDFDDALGIGTKTP